MGMDITITIPGRALGSHDSCFASRGHEGQALIGSASAGVSAPADAIPQARVHRPGFEVNKTARLFTALSALVPSLVPSSPTLGSGVGPCFRRLERPFRVGQGDLQGLTFDQHTGARLADQFGEV